MTRWQHLWCGIVRRSAVVWKGRGFGAFGWAWVWRFDLKVENSGTPLESSRILVPFGDGIFRAWKSDAGFLHYQLSDLLIHLQLGYANV